MIRLLCQRHKKTGPQGNRHNRENGKHGNRAKGIGGKEGARTYCEHREPGLSSLKSLALGRTGIAARSKSRGCGLDCLAWRSGPPGRYGPPPTSHGWTHSRRPSATPGGPTLSYLLSAVQKGRPPGKLGLTSPIEGWARFAVRTNDSPTYLFGRHDATTALRSPTLPQLHNLGSVSALIGRGKTPGNDAFSFPRICFNFTQPLTVTADSFEAIQYLSRGDS